MKVKKVAASLRPPIMAKFQSLEASQHSTQAIQEKNWAGIEPASTLREALSHHSQFYYEPGTDLRQWLK